MPRPVGEQVVVIIGASSGIGRASALEFARQGARVVCAARTQQALDSLVDEITGKGGTAIAVPTDVTDAVMSLRRVAVGAQTGDRPDSGTDNVDRPADEPGRMRGDFTGTVMEHSAFTALFGQRRRPTELPAALREKVSRR